ncbi:hypothetical protein [Trichormus sp. NMC-1]|nr:hypothetical protein [Trichormus sp. NMC-1]
MINTSKQHKCDRQFRWISSVTGDPEIIENLNQKMEVCNESIIFAL